MKKMHPKNIVEDVEEYDSKLLLENGELVLESPEKVGWEIEEFIVSHKSRIIDYLSGKDMDKQHAVDQTVAKIFLWWQGVKQPGDKTIHFWTVSEPDSIGLLLELSIELAQNGWKNPKESYIPYETERSKEIANELYESAIAFANRRR